MKKMSFVIWLKINNQTIEKKKNVEKFNFDLLFIHEKLNKKNFYNNIKCFSIDDKIENEKSLCHSRLKSIFRRLFLLSPFTTRTSFFFLFHLCN
jgi:hypothetical protein